jgi:hypothetical protein
VIAWAGSNGCGASRSFSALILPFWTLSEAAMGRVAFGGLTDRATATLCHATHGDRGTGDKRAHGVGSSSGTPTRWRQGSQHQRENDPARAPRTSLLREGVNSERAGTAHEERSNCSRRSDGSLAGCFRGSRSREPLPTRRAMCCIHRPDATRLAFGRLHPSHGREESCAHWKKGPIAETRKGWSGSDVGSRTQPRRAAPRHRVDRLQ